MNEKPVDFVGIPFRSYTHTGFFFVSASLLGMMIFLTFFSQVENLIFYFPIGLHLANTVLSFVFTRGGKIQGPTVSKDCIWFNGLLTLIYLLLWAIN